VVLRRREIKVTRTQETPVGLLCEKLTNCKKRTTYLTTNRLTASFEHVQRGPYLWKASRQTSRGRLGICALRSKCKRSIDILLVRKRWR